MKKELITLYLINKLASILLYIESTLFNGAIHTVFTSLGNNLSALSVPVTLYQVFELVCLFLPIGTIAILFNITMFLFALRFVFGLIHFIAHIGGIR